MIRLAGLRPDEDIEIEIVGTRPGERLHEQLHDDAGDRRADAAPVDPRPHAEGRRPTPTTLFYFLECSRRQLRRGAATRSSSDLLDQMLAECGVSVISTPTCRRRRSAPADGSSSRAEPTDRAGVDADRARHRPSRGTAAQLPALLGGDPGLRARPPVRPAGASAARTGRAAARSLRTTAACSRTARSSPSSRSASPSGSASPTSSRVSSCTSGLMLALQALTDGPPGPVVLPSFTFSASAHAVAWNGRTPRFVECRPDSFQIDARRTRPPRSTARARSSRRTCSARRATRRAVEELARAHGIPVVFDAAHAFGALRRRRRRSARSATPRCSASRPPRCSSPARAGSSRRTTPALAETLRIGRDYGNPGDYDTQFAGLNARMSEFHAAMALESLEHARRVARTAPPPRRACYRELPRRRSRHRVPGGVGARRRVTFKDFTITVDADAFGLDRDDLVARARRRGRRHPQLLRSAGAPPAGVRAPRTRATCPSPTRFRRRWCRCRSTPTSRRERACAVVDALATIHEYATSSTTPATRSRRDRTLRSPRPKRRSNGHVLGRRRSAELRESVGRRPPVRPRSARERGSISDRCRTSSPMLPKDEYATAKNPATPNRRTGTARCGTVGATPRASESGSRRAREHAHSSRRNELRLISTSHGNGRSSTVTAPCGTLRASSARAPAENSEPPCEVWRSDVRESCLIEEIEKSFIPRNWWPG